MNHGVRKILVKVECFDIWKFYRLHFLFFRRHIPVAFFSYKYNFYSEQSHTTHRLG